MGYGCLETRNKFGGHNEHGAVRPIQEVVQQGRMADPSDRHPRVQRMEPHRAAGRRRRRQRTRAARKPRGPRAEQAHARLTRHSREGGRVTGGDGGAVQAPLAEHRDQRSKLAVVAERVAGGSKHRLDDFPLRRRIQSGRERRLRQGDRWLLQ